MRQQNRQTAGARAHIDDAMHRRTRREQGSKLLRDDLEKVAARNDHALIDVKAVFAQPGFARKVRRRHPLQNAPSEDAFQRRALLPRQGLRKHALIAVQRDIQRAQYQVERLVMRVRCHLPQREFLPRIKLLGKSQPVAGRRE